MEEGDLDYLKLAIQRADLFSFIFVIILFIMVKLNVISKDSIFGLAIGYIGVKLVFTKLYMNVKNNMTLKRTAMFLNLIIYGIVMIVAIKHSKISFVLCVIMIIGYRIIVLNTFKQSFQNKR